MAAKPTIHPQPQEAHELSGDRSKTRAVPEALEACVAQQRQSRGELFSRMSWDPEFDYKAERSRR